MKKILAISLVVIISSALQANAFSWGNLFGFNSNTVNNPTTKATNATTAISAFNMLQQVSSLTNQSQSLDSAIQKSFLSLALELSPADDVNALRNSFTQANKTASESIRSMLINQAITNYAQSLNNNQTSVISALQNLSKSKQRNLLSTVNALSNYGNQYSNLGQQSSNIVSGLLSATQQAQSTYNTLNQAKQTATELTERANAILAVVNELRTLINLAGI